MTYNISWIVISTFILPAKTFLKSKLCNIFAKYLFLIFFISIALQCSKLGDGFLALISITGEVMSILAF